MSSSSQSVFPQPVTRAKSTVLATSPASSTPTLSSLNQTLHSASVTTSTSAAAAVAVDDLVGRKSGIQKTGGPKYVANDATADILKSSDVSPTSVNVSAGRDAYQTDDSLSALDYHRKFRVMAMASKMDSLLIITALA